MTGPENYREASLILTGDDPCSYGCPHSGCPHEMASLTRAQAHATLALAAAVALPGQHPGDWEREIWAFGPDGGPPGGAPEATP